MSCGLTCGWIVDSRDEYFEALQNYPGIASPTPLNPAQTALTSTAHNRYQLFISDISLSEILTALQ
jgi:hypothetical protein